MRRSRDTVILLRSDRVVVMIPYLAKHNLLLLCHTEDPRMGDLHRVCVKHY